MTATADPLPCDDDAADPTQPVVDPSPTAAIIEFRLGVAAQCLRDDGAAAERDLADLLDGIAAACRSAHHPETLAGTAESIRWTPVLMTARKIAERVLPPIPEV